MEGKTRVLIKDNYNQATHKVDQVGFIDGYLRGGDNRPYAVVIVRDIIDMVPLHCLKVLS